MPSAKILSEKQAYVADLKAKFESAVSGCVVAYGGINVENDTKLRKELREAGVDYMVVKNTMLRLAVKGTSLAHIGKLSCHFKNIGVWLSCKDFVLFVVDMLYIKQQQIRIFH